MPSFPATPPNPAYPRFMPLGDTALSVEFGDSISPELNAKVLALDAALAAAALDGIQETILAILSRRSVAAQPSAIFEWVLCV